MIYTKDLPTDDSYPLSSLYWIYHEELHTDPSKSGYVGVACGGTDKRFLRHLGDAKNNSCFLIHKAMRKHGDKIKVKTLLLAAPEICLLLEEMLRPIACMEGTWNIRAGGSKSMLGYKPSQETRQKLRLANKGRVVSAEQRKKQSITNTGKRASMASRTKMSLARKGKLLNLTDAERLRRSNFIKSGIMHTPECLEKSRQKLLGRHLSESHKKSLSLASKGVKKTEDHSAKISFALRGKEKSQEHKSAMSTAQLKLHKNIAPWENYRANLDAWSKAIDIAAFLRYGNKCSDGELAKLFNIPKRSYIVTIRNNCINGWLPEADHKYLAWLSEYKQKQELANGT